MFIYPQSGNQFVVEGFIIGFLNILCALLLIFMTVGATRFKSESIPYYVIGSMIFAFFSFYSVKSLYKYN